MSERKKNLITWKDADQNLCTVAAAIFDAAMRELRANYDQDFWYPTDDGGRAESGMCEESGNRTFWSTDRSVPEVIREGLSQQCWWSFQNIIRMRLAQSRQEIQDNLYPQNRQHRTSKQSSRNPDKRRDGSKYGRQPERAG